MNIVHLNEITGCRPPGQIGNLDNYVAEQNRKGRGIFDVLKEVVVSERERIIRAQGFAPYVGGLVEQLIAGQPDMNSMGRGSLTCNDLQRTFLTSLFEERYDIPISEYTQSRPGALRMHSSVFPEESFTIDYQLASSATETGVAETFWQVNGYDVYGFVNMSCVGGVLPLRGKGNIAFIPGVEEALTADIQALAQRSTVSES